MRNRHTNEITNFAIVIGIFSTVKHFPLRLAIYDKMKISFNLVNDKVLPK